MNSVSTDGVRRPETGRGPSRTLVEIFAGTVAEHAGDTALTADGDSFSYRRLDDWSRAVGAELRSHGVRRGDRVALRMPPGAEAVAAILGILKAGAAYVPLDVHNPPSRNRFVVGDSGVTAFVGDPDGCLPGDASRSTLREADDGTVRGTAGDVLPDAARPTAPGAAGIPVIGRERVATLRDAPVAAPAGSDRADPPPGPDDTAYVIYTSGTTGRPKGVPIHHGAVAALLAAAAQRFSFSAADRWLLFHSVAFDVSVWEMWGAFSTGGRLVVLPHWTARSPEGCLRVIAEMGISVLNQTPTAFGSLAAAALRENADLPSLRYVVFAGEKLLPGKIRPWAERFGLARPTLVNMYGITETTVHSTFHEVTGADLEGDVSVVGRPLPGFAHRVITSDGRDAEPGEQGVLWLAGPQVSRGYLNRPELDAERFADMPAPGGGPDLRYYRSGDLVSPTAGGDLVYHGREDLQVKLRGYRIELSDIETAVQSHDLVADAVVWVREFQPGDERLVCAYVPAGPTAGTTAGAGTGAEAGTGTAVDARVLRDHVKNLLPSYMRPAGYRPLPQLPRTVNGKVNRDEVARKWEEGKENGR
ncbi:amino acid adenylation domain-containing protein [Streptosporangium becharense]|uniref:Amino acid adenylation domain-containing protein n=1 Tax=Streptosporangium becharense TaxID=1816182 RepID=A0A7W9IJI2_9ACTN|nr:amino acid adenylation domain-containing protein [Streptosporangium becharense]MBB2911043.1 amino acid adenylation domain-containing protein [Streptosporangium becharense]MBB5821899.1 amino acid adenylation domain-containing protein [Streptosporangium becharense]